MNKQLFICTTDKETAEKMISEGFQLVEKGNNIWKFLNDTSKIFKFENKKITYSNMLNI